MTKGTQSTRLQSLETKAGVNRRPGGVIVVGQPETSNQWDETVAEAQARAGPGAHLIVPGMALDAQEWEQQAKATQRRLAAEDARRRS